MTTDEQAIVDYLKGWRDTFVSGKEIARKVGGKERYEEDRNWALPILAQLARVGLVEGDLYGYYRLKQQENKKKDRVHIAPQILKILKSSGKSFGTFNLDSDMDDDAIPTYRPQSKTPAAKVPAPKASTHNVKKTG